MEMSAEELRKARETGRMPHKHRDLIKAWADDTSLVFQCREPRAGRLNTQWVDIPPTENMYWYDGVEYRIKPKTIKYRNFLWKTGSEQIVVCVTNEQENYLEPRINWSGFLEWLGDWQEVEV